MNWKRVVAGGLVAGIVLNVGEFVVEPLMGPQMENFFRRLSLPMPGEASMIALAAAAMALGVVAVWLYAALKPALGAGMRTAATAGVVVWLLSCLFPNIIMLAFGLFAAKLFWFATVWPLIETVVATMAGAKLYRDDTVPAAAPVRA
jgi:hypothetical protein